MTLDEDHNPIRIVPAAQRAVWDARKAGYSVDAYRADRERRRQRTNPKEKPMKRTFRFAPGSNEPEIVVELSTWLGGVHVSITDPGELIEDVTINGDEKWTDETPFVPIDRDDVFSGNDPRVASVPRTEG